MTAPGRSSPSVQRRIRDPSGSAPAIREGGSALQFRPLVGALATASLAAAALAPLPAAADGPVYVKLQLGDRCVAGHKTSDDPITVKLLRSNGTVIQTRHDDTTDLTWKVCFSSSHVPVHGNRLRLIHFTTDRTVSIPDLTVALDRATSVVRGHGPVGKTIELDALSCDAIGKCTEDPPVMVTANGQGRYHKDLSPDIDIDGSDVASAGYTNSHQDVFVARGQAPYMTITKPDKVTLSCMPAGNTTVKVRSHAGVLRASRTFHIGHDCGSATWTLHLISLHTGDRIMSDFASDANVVWPRMSVSAHDTRFSVRCFPDTYAFLSVTDNGTTATDRLTTDAEGRYSTGASTIPEGAALRVVCESKPGDRVVAKARAT